MTEQEHAEWLAAYADELTKGGTEADVLQRAGERTAHLWGCHTTSDGQVVMRQPEADREAGS